MWHKAKVEVGKGYLTSNYSDSRPLHSYNSFIDHIHHTQFDVYQNTEYSQRISTKKKKTTHDTKI